MKQQRIKVNTKGGLLAALECVRDYPGKTRVILQRESGKTEYNFWYNFDELNKKSKKYYSSAADIQMQWDKQINNLKKKIKRIAAKDLLY